MTDKGRWICMLVLCVCSMPVILAALAANFSILGCIVAVIGITLTVIVSGVYLVTYIKDITG